MNKSNILDTLAADLNKFAKNLDRVLSNERDLQVRLAMYLKDLKSHYDEVEMEYAIPLEILGYTKPPRRKNGETEKDDNFEGSAYNFPWPHDIYADIVVKKDDKFAIVELKYGTRALNKSLYDHSRFGVGNAIPIIKTQGAQDITMYNYCKDIRRIEHLSEKFPNLVGGVALLITNDHLYWEEPTNPVGYEKFSLHKGNDIKDIVWRPEFSEKVIKSHPDFSLAKSYHCHWEDTAWDNANKDEAKMKKGYIFRYLLTVVEKQ